MYNSKKIQKNRCQNIEHRVAIIEEFLSHFVANFNNKSTHNRVRIRK